jgi:hypothetical protein
VAKLHFPVRVQDQHAVNAPMKELDYFGFATSVGSECSQESAPWGIRARRRLLKGPNGKVMEQPSRRNRPREIHTVQCLGFVLSVW